MSNRVGDVELVASWEANAAQWTKVVREGTIESRRLVTDNAVVQAVMDQAPRRVLDLGCGEGWLSRELKSNGAFCVGIDASGELIHAARHADPGGTYDR